MDHVVLERHLLALDAGVMASAVFAAGLVNVLQQRGLLSDADVTALLDDLTARCEIEVHPSQRDHLEMHRRVFEQIRLVLGIGLPAAGEMN